MLAVKSDKDVINEWVVDSFMTKQQNYVYDHWSPSSLHYKKHFSK